MNKLLIIVVVLILALGATGFFVYKTLFPSTPAPTTSSQSKDDQSTVDTSLPENTSVSLDVSKSKQKDNSVTLTVSKLDSSYTSLAYEITYDTKGVIQGVNSGSKPIDISGQASFTKDIYLGTCSKNVCTPHTGVTSISVALELTDSSGKKSQLSKDFPL